ncbi:MAG: glycosyltransferase family 2 protein [Thermoleophilia bacterium]|nr:glycosyltransferase family 2 protein [Thermoleophilia bacterium]
MDATILIPTFRHAVLLPYAVRSALAQEGVEIELFVVGDGVEDDTRAALEPFLADPRVRFFDRRKGQRNGERLRHEALQESTAPIVCYLADDNLFLPGHVAQMRALLERADFAQDLPVNIWADGSLRYNAFDLGNPVFVERLAAGLGGGGLTRAAHTRDAYDRLPYGWRPAPPDIATDIYMWQQFLTIPGFTGVTSDHLTSLIFPSPLRTHMTAEERAAELEVWQGRIRDPQFPAVLDAMVATAARRAAERLKLKSVRLERELERIQRTRWWRARRAVAKLKPVRALRARCRDRS